MSYLDFSKEQLVNLSYSSVREIIRCSRAGAFAFTTLSGLHTRKYHGLFIAPQDKIDKERHLLVSGLNEVVIINNMEFRIGTYQYKGGIIDPKGNKYLQHFQADPVPTFKYRVGKFDFSKELLFLKDEDRVIIKYKMLNNFNLAAFCFKPLLAFRNIHALTKKNDFANTDYKPIDNGVQYCLYPNYTPVCFQFSKNTPLTYTHEPVWYENFEYIEEFNRGYDYHEDLLNAGKLNVDVNNNEIYFTIGSQPIDPLAIEYLYNKEFDMHTSRNSYFFCLKNAAEQFIVERNGKTNVIAGYPWFGSWGRDTFIALHGLSLSLDNPDLCKKIIDSNLQDLNKGLFPNIGGETDVPVYNSVDAPLWFIRCLQQYTEYCKNEKQIWKSYGDALKTIINSYKDGTNYNIKMQPDGLIYAGDKNVALTWMDAIVDSLPVTPRTGCPVEINGLWYNAIKFCYEMADLANDKEFCKEWKELIHNFPTVFKETFWSKEKGYLADYVNGDYKNFQVRPNMLIVASLPYCPVSEKIKQLIVKKCMEELLTERGIRSLSPNDPDYKGIYKGNQAERDMAYHQGTCWVWLLAPFADAMFSVYKKQAIPFLSKIFYDFEQCMKQYGISTIAEIYDGDPPHNPNGAISQAWSVSALLYIRYLVNKFS